MAYTRTSDSRYRHHSPIRALDGAQPAILGALAQLAVQRVLAAETARRREAEAADVARRLRWPTSTQSFVERLTPFRLPTPWFHEVWYAAYDDPDKPKIFVQAPREHAKSSSILRYVLRRLCEDHHVRVGVVSGTDPLAKLFLNELKTQLEQNETLIDLYGGPFVGDKWTEHEIVLRDARTGPGAIAGKDVSVFAVGRGGQISSRHCDILVVDDVETKDTVKSELMRADTKSWYSKEVVPVVSPGGKVIATGTRKHYDDLYSILLGPDAGYHVLDQAKTVWMPDGEPIWAEMWDKAALLARKAELDAVDVLAWPQEYENNPLPPGTQMFRPDEWPTYNGVDPHGFAAALGLTIFQAWDLAISEKTTADFTVGWTIGVDDRNNVYLLERRRGHWDFNTQLGEIEEMGRSWPTAASVGIEDVAYQAAAVQEALRRTMLPVISMHPDKDKVTRARILEARAKPGKVYRPINVPWWSEFATEAAYFPAGSHDDQVDSLTMAVRLAGWDASSVAWAYGIWKCHHCGHGYGWAANRPCPKCGTKAPAEYPNPEMVDAPQVGVLSDAQWAIVGLIDRGMGVPPGTDRARTMDDVQRVAAWYIDGGQEAKAVLALDQARQLNEGR